MRRGLLVLYRAAGEEGDPTQLGEVRDSGLRRACGVCSLISLLRAAALRYAAEKDTRVKPGCL
jgi:hypothetical protein